MYRRFSEFIFGRPGPLILGVALAALIAISAGFVILGFVGLHPIQGVSAASMITDGLSAFLALGTFSLAYAAGLQAYSAEKSRIANLRPYLGIALFEQGRGPRGPDSVPLTSGPFSTDCKGVTTIPCLIRNSGPGNATQVRFRGVPWYMEGSGPWGVESIASGPLPTEPEVDSRGEYLPWIEGESIPVGGERLVAVELARPVGSNFEQAGTYRIARRMLIFVEGKSVEGRSATRNLALLELQKITPWRFMTELDRLTEGNPTSGLGYQLTWRLTYNPVLPLGSGEAR